ncbi:MAG: rhodanese-like domain-containing protein [Anaerolineae bacterium]|jgi:rhodanese-related sulfurtransferase
MKFRALFYLSLLALLALLLAACGSTSTSPEQGGEVMGFARNADGYADVTAEQAAGLLEDQDLTVVNVHIPYEGEIPQTDLFIPFDEILAHQDELPAKDAPILLYCRSGSMSTTAAQDLVEAGYTNIMEMDGGFRAWETAGYQLLNNP